LNFDKTQMDTENQAEQDIALEDTPAFVAQFVQELTPS